MISILAIRCCDMGLSYLPVPLTLNENATAARPSQCISVLFNPETHQLRLGDDLEVGHEVLGDELLHAPLLHSRRLRDCAVRRGCIALLLARRRLRDNGQL